MPNSILGAALSIFLLAGCLATEESACEPGETQICFCTAVLEGVQECNGDGAAWSGCDCNGEDEDTAEQDTAEQDTGDDPTEPPPECIPESEASVTLCADRFWTQVLDTASQAEMEAAIADMPAELRDEDLEDPVDRARQLQWVIVATNAISATSVTVLLPDGTYDFTGLDEAHSSVPKGDFYQEPLRPKLFVHRDDVTLRPAWEGAEPVLTASGPGVDGLHHGRVFLLLDSSYTRLVVQGLIFRGDAVSGTFTDPAYSLHENAKSLYWLAQWGSVMVGLNGGANLATFNDCRFERVNGSAISAVGLLEVSDCVFEGALPDPEETDPETASHALLDAIAAEMGTSWGMDFHSGIRRTYAYGPTQVERSSFSSFVQGVVASADGFPIQVSDSTFTAIYDHGIYVLGDAGGSLLEGNRFERTGNSAVKFAGHTEEIDADLSVAGLHDGAIRDNLFVQARNASVQFAGVRNEISGNEVQAYDQASDPTGWYDPYANPDYHYPDVWCSTEAGQAGWADHIVGNDFQDNTSSDGSFALFFHQDPDVADRSISQNIVSGAGQTAYFHHLVPCSANPMPCSEFEPSIQIEGGANLVIGAPKDCADCYPNDPFYLSELP